jgi:basic amino acid/polyamine antiporter, APA family
MATDVSTPRSAPVAHGRAGGESRIGLVSCVAFAVGTMVGAGVFVLSGLAVEKAGPAAIVAFALAGVLVLLSALSFAVVASLARAGEGGYGFVGRALGGYWGFLTSWAFWLGGVIGAAFVLNAFGEYLHQFFVSSVPTVVWALIGAGLLTLLNLGPASAIGRAETVLVAVKIGILALLIVFALIHLGRADFTPFAPHGAGSVFTTSGLLFIAYLGFNVVCNMAGDVEDAQRTVPRAILISMALVAVVYVGVVIALLAGQLHTFTEASVGTAAKRLMGAWGGILIPIGALVSTLSAGNANILGASEIMVRLAARRQVPTVLGRMWRGHPAVSVLGGAVLYTVLILSRQTQAVVSLANVAAIVAMTLVNVAAAVALRRRTPGALRLPLGPVLPALGLLAALAQLIFIGRAEVAIGLLLVAAGSVSYWLRDRFHQPAHHARLTAAVDRSDTPAGRALRRAPRDRRAPRPLPAGRPLANR